MPSFDFDNSICFCQKVTKFKNSWLPNVIKLSTTLAEKLTLTTYIEILVLFNIQCKQFKKRPSLLNAKITF